MSKQFISLLLGALLSVNVVVLAQSKVEKLAAKNKIRILDLGTNQTAKLKLASGETIEGRIVEIKADSFAMQILAAQNQITTRELAYGDVTKINARKESSAHGSFKNGVATGLGLYAGLMLGGLIAVGIATIATRR